MKSMMELRNNPAFLKAYLSRAREIEYDAARLIALLEKMQEAECEALTRKRSLESEQKQYRQAIHKMEQQIRTMDETPENVGETALMAAGISLILLLIFRNSVVLNAIFTILSLGNSWLGLLEFLVILPGMIGYSMQSSNAKNRAEANRQKLRNEIHNTKAKLAVLSHQVEILDKQVLPYIRNHIRQCASERNCHEGKRADFYRICGFLHPNYRNMVASHTIFSYLDTNRCVSLDGHGGAVDTYELERRLNIIIDNLAGLRRQVSAIGDHLGALRSQSHLIERIGRMDCNIDALAAPMRHAVRQISESGQGKVPLRRLPDVESFYSDVQDRDIRYIDWVRANVG